MVFISKEVKVLLDRMDTNPEEFTTFYDSKWEPFFPRGSCFNEFNLFEQRAIRKKLSKVRSKLAKQRAYERVMTTLIGGEQSDSEETSRFKTYADMMREKIHAEMMAKEQEKLQLEIMRHNAIMHMKENGQL